MALEGQKAPRAHNHYSIVRNQTKLLGLPVIEIRRKLMVVYDIADPYYYNYIWLLYYYYYYCKYYQRFILANFTNNFIVL